MPTLNLTQANTLYYGNTEVQKLYKGNQQLYPLVNPDPYWDNVTFLLRGNNIIDISKTPKTIVNNGVTVDTAQFKYGSNSLLFNATSSYLTVTHADMALGTNPFTIEAWIRKTSFSSSDTNINDALLSFSTGSVDPRIVFYTDDLNNPFSIPNLFTNKHNQWLHIAYARESTATSMTKFYLNGVLSGSHTFSTNHTATQMNIGAYSSLTAYNLNGWLQCFRVTKGIARYTANFNPETNTYLAY